MTIMRRGSQSTDPVGLFLERVGCIKGEIYNSRLTMSTGIPILRRHRSSILWYLYALTRASR
jgi:hypothetical protein